MKIIKCPNCDYIAPNKKSISNHLRYGCNGYDNNKVCKYCGNPLISQKPKEQGFYCNQKCYSMWRSENLKGDKAPNYIHGKCNDNLLIRASLEYRQWREKVFKRDNYTCKICGDNSGGNLQADHIKSFALYPNLRFDINNGRTLCNICHKQTDNYGFTKENVRSFYE